MKAIQNFRPFQKTFLATSVAALLGGSFGSGKVNAATLTWNDVGPSNLWSTAVGNWVGPSVWVQDSDALFNGVGEAIDVSTANTINDVTFSANGYSITSSGAGSFVLSNDLASTITVTNLADSTSIAETIANNAAGASSLTKAGLGTLTLNGTAASTYSGGTTISAGTLTLSHEGALGTGAVTNNATLNLNKFGTGLVYTGLSTAMSGSGVTNVTLGAGTVTTVLNGDYSAYTGTWNVGVSAGAGAGKVQLQGLDNALATVNVLSNATVFVGAAVTKNASIVLNGGDTGEALGQLRVEGGGVWAGSITLAGAMTGTDSFIGANGGIGTYSGVIGETGGARVLSKGGAGTSVLSGTNTYSGGTTVLNGAISVSVLNNTGVAGNIGTGSTISLGNGTTGAQLIYTGAGETTDRVINLAGTTGGGVLTQSGASGHLKFTSAMTATGTGGNKTLTLQGSTAGTAELAGAVVNSTGTTAITKAGSGTWTLSGTNTNTGATAVNGGTLRLNYDAGAGGTDTNKLGNAGALTLGGGTLELIGGSHTEVVASTALTNLTTNFVTRTGGTSVLAMGAITPNSGTVTFSADGIATTTTANINGILGPWAKVNSNWATNSGGSIVAYTAYTDVSQFFDGTPAGTIPNSVANNIRIINGGTTGNITLAGGALTQANTLQNTSSGATIDPANATDVLNIGDNIGGGIWQTSGAGSLVIGTAADDGVLTTGGAINAAAANLRITNDSVNNIVVNSLIANNGTDVVTVTKTGNGTLVLNGSDSYTGSTVVKEGTLTLAGNRTVTYAVGSVFTVGDTAGVNATLNISGGTHSIGGASSRINVGNQAGVAGTSTVNQTGGAIVFNVAAGDMLLVGQNTVGNTGIYNLSGGSITTFTNASRGVILGVNSNLAPGPTSGGGTFNLSGTGALNMTAASGGTGDAILQIGRSDAVGNNTTNLFNQTGGTANVGILSMGGAATSGSTGVNSTLTLTGGTFSANSFTLLAAAATNTATVNIGGTANVTLPAFPTARGANSTATLNFDGGTLRPTATSATYISGLTNAFIKTGGANFDTNGFNITVPQPLLEHAVNGGGGLSKSGAGNLTLTGASTFTGATSVTGGSLIVDASGSVNGSSGISVNGATAKLLQINTTTAITPAVTLTQGTVDGTGTINSLTVADLAANVLTNGNGSTGALTLGSLTFGGDAIVNVNTAGSPGITVTGALATTPVNGQVTINVPVAPVWANTTYNLIGYGSWAGALTDLTQGTIAGLGARQSAVLGTTGASNGFITLTVSGDSVEWTGVASGIWSTTPILTPYNWKLQIAGTAAEFLATDSAVFNDNATGTTTVEINDATVAPTSVLFDNATKNYTVIGTNGITSGTVTKSGTGSVTMNTANTHTGGTFVNAGTLNIGNASALGAVASALTLNGGAIDNTTGAALTTPNHPLVINGDFAFTGSNPLSLGAGAANLGAAAGTARTITVNASTLTLGGVIANGATANGITKAGNGTLILAAANTYTGTTTINAGTVNIQNNAALGTSAGGTTIASGATLDLSTTLAANALNLGTEVITISGSGVGGAGAIVNNGTNDQINALGRLVLAGDATVGGTKRFDLRSSTPTLDMGGFTLTKIGGNQVSLVGVTVSNPGNITINGGIFGVETTTNLGGSSANAINVNEFATLTLFANTNPVAWTVNLTDGTLAQNSGNATVSGPVTLTGANTITNTLASTSLTLSGVVSGTGGFTKAGAHQLNLSGDNTYDGPTTITTGRVVVSHANALGSAVGATSVANNAILQVAGGVTTNAGENVTIVGPGSDFVGALQGGTGGGTWAGGVTLGDAAVRIGATTGNTLTITGTIADGAGTGFNVSGQTGTGVVVINPTTSNTYTGLTGIIRGTLRIGKNDALPTGTTLDIDSAINVADAVAFDLGGFNQTVGALQDTATAATGLGSTVTNSVAATTSTLTVNGSTSTIFNGVIQNGAGTVALSKDGSGTLQLAGVSTYTGPTQITGGALILTANGAISASISGSAVTVSGTGTLSGTGTVGALTALSGGTIAPGASPGVLNSGALSMTTGSTLSIEINGTTVGTGYDQLSVTGGVNITGATLTLGGTFNAGATNDLFTIMLNDGAGDSVTGTFAGLAEGAHAFSVSGQEFAISYVGGDGNDIVLTAVPEPGSAMLLLGGLALLGARRRRRA